MRESNMRLVKFSCGCVGFEPGEDKRALVVRACDSDWADSEFSFFRRDMADAGGVKGSSPLGRAEAEAMLEKIGLLVADGYGLRAVKSVLAPRSR